MPCNPGDRGCQCVDHLPPGIFRHQRRRKITCPARSQCERPARWQTTVHSRGANCAGGCGGAICRQPDPGRWRDPGSQRFLCEPGRPDRRDVSGPKGSGRCARALRGSPSARTASSWAPTCAAASAHALIVQTGAATASARSPSG